MRAGFFYHLWVHGKLEQSDIITFHNYDIPDELRKCINGLQKLGRPVLCTEYMARGNHSTFTDNLPVMKEFTLFFAGIPDATPSGVFPQGRFQRVRPGRLVTHPTIHFPPGDQWELSSSSMPGLVKAMCRVL